ncbi:MAG: NAD(P)-dependent oxidoreductase [Ideonella sp.]|nr:NAD(P)-dependent oxidoreductase [Ideonella sp.]MCC7456009.1 NAD(P)-dependent oxidoreductase [Nitrospira sp.]
MPAPGSGDAAPIGVIGVGNMGLAMALRLLERGHAVQVRDLRADAEAAAAAAGARAVATPAALAATCELVIIAVVDAAQCEAVLFGEQGLAAVGAPVPRPHATVLLCPTIAPHDGESIAAQLAARRWACIDAPMSGGPQRARDGTMSLMVACADALFDHHRLVLGELSARIVRIGERVGDGARTKLVNNLLAAVNLAGAAEAIALAERLGLDAQRTLQVFEQSSAQSWIGSDRMARALAGDFAPRAHTSLLAKDSTLALAMARAAQAEPPLGALAQALFAQACAEGHASLDDASLLLSMRQRLAPR